MKGKEKMKRYTLLILLSLFALAGRAQDSADLLFEQANAVYNTGNYDSARIIYEKILATDMESVPLYFNLGNACYKLHEYPMAIYYYEKALKLDPSNEEVQANLAIANHAIVDKIEPVPQSFIVRGWHNVRVSLSGDQWAWCSIVFFGLLLVSLFLFLRSRRVGVRKLGFFAGILFLLAFGLSVAFSWQLKQASETCDQAILMQPTVMVKSSPSEISVDLFVLHEGTKVTVLETSNGWSKIKIANGSVGWLTEDSILLF